MSSEPRVAPQRNARRRWLVGLAVVNASCAVIVLVIHSLAFGHAYAATVVMLFQRSTSLLEDHAAYEDARVGVLRVHSGTSDAALIAALMLGVNAVVMLVFAWRADGRHAPNTAVPALRERSKA